MIVGMTGCGKTYYLLNMLEEEYFGHFEYIFLICPTYNWNKTYQEWTHKDCEHFYPIPSDQNSVEDFIKYFLRLLKRAGLDHSSQLAVYTTCIRSVLEYGCQVWNYGASQYLSDDVERVQRRALRIIYPDLSYRKALEVTSLPSLSQRRDELCRSYFIKMTDPTHKLHYLLPDKRSNSLRNNDNFTYIWSYTNRFKNSYIPSSVVSFNTYNNS